MSPWPGLCPGPGCDPAAPSKPACTPKTALACLRAVPGSDPFRVSRQAGAAQQPDGLSGKGQSLALRCLPLPW